MLKCKILLFSLFMASIVTSAYCQEKPENQKTYFIGGKVVNVDSVGNVITISTQDHGQMAFSVPDKTNITQETHAIGLLEIGVSDPVIVQYYVPSPGKYTVISIVDSKPVGSV